MEAVITCADDGVRERHMLALLDEHPIRVGAVPGGCYVDPINGDSHAPPHDEVLAWTVDELQSTQPRPVGVEHSQRLHPNRHSFHLVHFSIYTYVYIHSKYIHHDTYAGSVIALLQSKKADGVSAGKVREAASSEGKKAYVIVSAGPVGRSLAVDHAGAGDGEPVDVVEHDPTHHAS